MKKYLGPGTFLANIGALLSGNGAGQVINLLIAPVITRLYSPEDMGEVGLILVFMGVATALTTLKYENAIVAEKSESAALQILAICLILCLPLSIFTTGIAAIIIWQGSWGFDLLSYKTLPWIFFLTLFVSIINALKFWFIRLEKFNPVATQVVTMNVLRAIGIVGLGFLKASWFGYILGEVLGRVFSLWAFAKHLPLSTWKQVKFHKQEILSLLKRHKNFPKITLPSTFISTLAVSIPTPLLADKFGADVAGFYVLTHRMILGTSGIMGAVFADAFHGRLAKYSRESARESYIFFKKTSVLLAAMGGAALFVLLFWAPQIFTLVFGEGWSKSGELARIMAPWAFFQLLVSPTSRLILIFDWQKIKFVYDIILLVFMTLAFVLVEHYLWSVNTLVLYLTVVNSVAYGSLYTILLFKIRRHSQLNPG